MNKALIAENKKKLLAEQKRLRAILEKHGRFEGKGEFPGDYKPAYPEIGQTDDENASESTQFGTNLAVARDLEARLTKIEAALARIADGTYGRCKAGDEIEEKRLRAVPETETCTKHAKS